MLTVNLKSSGILGSENETLVILAVKLSKSQNELTFFGCSYMSNDKEFITRFTKCHQIDFSSTMENIAKLDEIEMAFVSIDVGESIELKVRI